ncbi:hypothetical protein [Nocardiopsis halotolerans]|uniref:hypothetical protein n=1 Tax=Nocardiopsis halotolerans TaxID=124252 RepID=UPI00034CB8C8|nr:hypothetical protein [Nocardiopsis halotolerans]
MENQQPASPTVRGMLLTGLIVTAVIAIAPLVDLAGIGTVASHVRAAYPDWPDAYVDAERSVITGYLVIIGALGTAAWAWSLVRARRRRIRVSAIVLFVLGLAAAAAHLGVSMAEYERVIPTVYGILWTLPAAVGAVIVVMTLRGGAARSSA